MVRWWTVSSLLLLGSLFSAMLVWVLCLTWCCGGRVLGAHCWDSHWITAGAGWWIGAVEEMDVAISR